MNIFNSSRIWPSRWGEHGSISVSIRDRGYEFCESIFKAFETPDEENKAHTYAHDMDEFCSTLKLPKFIKNYYHFKQNFADNNKPSNSSYRRYYCLIPNRDLSKFVFDYSTANDVMEVIRTKVPIAFANISEDTARQFVHVLDENSKPDISVIYFMPTKRKVVNPGSRWGEYTCPIEYILVDRLLNPIDVNKFVNVVNKIVVKPKSET